MIYWITYGVGWIICARILAGMVAYDMAFRDEAPDGQDWGFGWCLGGIFAFIWPALLIGWGLTHATMGVGKERQHRLKEKNDKQKRELEATRTELRRLEREVGLPPWEMESYHDYK